MYLAVLSRELTDNADGPIGHHLDRVMYHFNVFRADLDLFDDGDRVNYRQIFKYIIAQLYRLFVQYRKLGRRQLVDYLDTERLRLIKKRYERSETRRWQ